ncbi:hypothetical protein CYMTET_39265 [Cymbomonas tetramitiformis]|uniref:Uncharacterized protein n=1 Tax=Cymbomonas tetramitiformis TaxID=36881 RepID=A0AAE0CCI2_9CHLO|nr:hypothetical protein CYMTET_39265 [Cymbomonas tetramitiformis]|eukprot:gene16532-19630_t
MGLRISKLNDTSEANAKSSHTEDLSQKFRQPLNSPIVYGRVSQRDQSTRYKVAFQQGILSDELLQYLSSDKHGVFQTAESKLESKKFCFKKCIDHPEIPGHRYYEGYWHASNKTGAVLESYNPRTGALFEKPAAPIALRAFVEAFRRSNAGWISKVIQESCLHQFVNENDVFSDLAVQFHCGDEVPEQSMAWHNDWLNSLLHMSISLGGNRTLYSKLALDEKEDVLQHAFEQGPGSIYISSPFAFEHAVRYERVRNWSDRIIAIQCRFLFPIPVIEAIQNAYDTDRFRELTQHIATCLSTANVVIPSIQEVEEVAKSLSV